MDAPYSLLTLPHPLDTINGKAQSSPVFALHGSRKRKREELAVGIDGEAVNIYKIQNQSLQTAYAIPPSTYLCCPPVSVHSRENGSRAAQRDTFIVLRDGPQDRKRRLVRFQEKLTGVAEFTTPSKTEYTLPEGDVRSVHALPSQTLGSNSSPQVLVTYVNGEVLCVAENMSRSVWKQDILEDDTSTIEALFLDDAASAQKGLLRSREDIMALLQLSETRSASLACFVIRSSEGILLRLCSITSGNTQGGLQRLDDIKIPALQSKNPAQWELSASTGQLCHLHDGMLDTYDLTGIIPRLSLTIRERNTQFTAFKHISTSLILATTSQKAILYDLQYGSIQGTVALDTGVIAASRKRKRQDEDAPAQGLSLHWFSELNTVIASSSTLLGIPLNSRAPVTSSKPIRLASVVGKSAAVHEVTTATDENSGHERNAWQREINELIANNDILQLERAVAIMFGVDLGMASTFDAEPGTETDEGSELPTIWDLESDVTDLGPNQKPRALELLQSMFEIDATNQQSPLRLKTPSRNVIRWLFSAEFVTKANLSTLLNPGITIKNVAQALVNADQSFQLVQDVLLLSIHLPSEFTVECLRLLIRSLDTAPKVKGTTDDMDIEDDDLDHEANAAEAELSNALNTLQSGLEIRSETMRLLFGRLHAIPKKTLTKALRTGLKVADLVFFIHLLRIELAEAGWTRSYVDFVDEEPLSASQEVEEDTSPSDRAIKTIGNLMIAAVDSIGPSGWLVGLTTDEDEQLGLLDALQAEIGASLEGVREAQMLRAYLDDFERYTLSLDDRVAAKQPNKHIEVQTTTDKTTSLPMGGRSAVVASQHVRKGKMPSILAKAKQKDSMVGLYQFERIRV